MRLTPWLWNAPSRKAARRPQREPVPFQQLLPLELKNKVSAKGDKTSDASCLQEMAVLFACFKKNEFNQQLCNPEIETFQSCFKAYKERTSFQREQDKKGFLTPGERNLTHRQLNKLMRAFPAQTSYRKKEERF